MASVNNKFLLRQKPDRQLESSLCVPKSSNAILSEPAFQKFHFQTGSTFMLGVSVIVVNTYSCYPTFVSKFGSDVTGNAHSRVVSEWELSLPL